MKLTRALVKTDSIIANLRNNRIHPPEQIDMLKASIERFGQPRPVLARKANRILIAGHDIHQAMLALRRPEITALFWDVGQKTADEFILGSMSFCWPIPSVPGRSSRTRPRTPMVRSASRVKTTAPDPGCEKTL